MLKIYNTLSQNIENFEPHIKNKVNMYVCGPTVYGDIHLGNARPVIFFDVVKRYLTYLGYDVHFVSNITDIDDKIIEKAKALKISEKELTDDYTKRFIDMTLSLGSVLPDELPKATNFVEFMITYIKELVEQGSAYQTSSGVYFRVLSVKDYGILSKQNMDELNEGVRIDLDQEKENPRDFSLWKNTTEGLNYDSPWGKGRPGWHTECAVMNHEIFKTEIDIHGGGSDLKFPHHENEIAQTVAHDHHHLAKYWMHVGRLNVDEVKMSKSIGNITLVKDLLEVYEPYAFRLLMINHHYRQPINYTHDLMIQFSKEYDKIKRTLKKAFLMLSLENVDIKDVDEHIMNEFKDYMNQDFNIPNVITLVYDVLKQINKEKDIQRIALLYQSVKTMLDILGIMPLYSLEDETLIMYRQWEEARHQKNFQLADQLRDQLSKRGWM
ncbi:cysteine--tRNA ligase [Mariniplasma anaerobium]|uniref:Cysteine--tRNA ligase n=1 Tax=Mariniplasma anaerobium TaxID=2735436 RepID=A0A7U9TLB4_9MOLU|nr:cysteine--tRNA ligase [Mariniplasma anaerobium]BCR35393.1 cysteine--tRNA ligase [Mariniplasma anaerobium]